jgi:integrase
VRTSGEGAVYETARGWRGYVNVGWQDTPRGRRPRRKYFSGTTKAAVERKIRNALEERDKGRLDTTTTPKVGQWLTTWLEKDARARVRQRTWTRYEELVRIHVIPEFGRKGLDKLTPMDVKQLHQTMRRNGAADATILQAHRILARALRVAMEWGLVHRNVATLAGGPTVTKTKAEPLTLDEARDLLDASAGDPLEARWVWGLACGPRQGEALGVEWPSFDEGEGDGLIVIRQQLQRLRPRHGCGAPTGTRTRVRRHGDGSTSEEQVPVWPCGKLQPARCPAAVGDSGLHLLETKSEDSWRYNPIPAPLSELFRRRRVRQLEERIEAGPRWVGWKYRGRQTDLIFTQPNGRPIDPRADSEAWHLLLEKAGVAPAKLKDARHTAATILLMMGVDVKVVQELLGHATPDFTRRVYQHVVPELAARGAKATELALWGKRDEPKDAADARRRRQRSTPRKVVKSEAREA